MPKFLIIDGSSMLSTSYYGNLPKSILFSKTEEEKEAHYKDLLHTSTGIYTNGIYTMFMTLSALFKKVHPDYIAFVFDKSRNTFRRTELGAESYKANRKETPVPLKQQFQEMEWAIEKMGFISLQSETYEADDYAASLVTKFEGPHLQTYVMTKDHDYEQLVSEYTRLWRVMSKEKLEQMKEAYHIFDQLGYDTLPAGVFEYTEAVVIEEEGVTPKQIPALLGITGDPTDGISGCKGVSSAAAPLLREYGTIKGIYEAIEECTDDIKKEKDLMSFYKEDLGISRNPINALKTYKEDVLLSEKLATMKADIPITQKLEDFIFQINKDGLKDVLERYEIKSISFT